METRAQSSVVSSTRRVRERGAGGVLPFLVETEISYHPFTGESERQEGFVVVGGLVYEPREYRHEMMS